MKMKKELKGWIKLPRNHFEESVAFSDSAYRMYDLLQALAGWDSKKTTFGVIDISLRKIQKDYLPMWSVSKVSLAAKELITHAVLQRENQTTLRLTHSWNPQKDASPMQQGVSSAKHTVLPARQNVLPAIHADKKMFEREREKLTRKLTEP